MRTTATTPPLTGEGPDLLTGPVPGTVRVGTDNAGGEGGDEGMPPGFATRSDEETA